MTCFLLALFPKLYNSSPHKRGCFSPYLIIRVSSWEDSSQLLAAHTPALNYKWLNLAYDATVLTSPFFLKTSHTDKPRTQGLRSFSLCFLPRAEVPFGKMKEEKVRATAAPSVLVHKEEGLSRRSSLVAQSFCPRREQRMNHQRNSFWNRVWEVQT